MPNFSRAMSPSVETITVDPRAAPSQSTTTLGSSAAGTVGFKTPRDQKPASIQGRMLGGCNDGAFNAREKHSLDNPQRVADDHLTLARERERRGDSFAGRGCNGVTEIARAADAQRCRRRRVIE